MFPYQPAKSRKRIGLYSSLFAFLIESPMLSNGKNPVRNICRPGNRIWTALGSSLLALIFVGLPAKGSQPVSVPNAHRIQFASDSVNHEYTLDIALPDSFATEENSRFPVIIVLDGQWNFPLVDHVADSLFYDDLIPETVVVGITYDLPYTELLERRRLDFLPGPKYGDDGVTGEADKFLQFLATELMPHLAKEYRVDTRNATLVGQSYGGVFTLHAFLSEPLFFRNWVAIHPVGNPPSAWQQRDPQTLVSAAELPTQFPTSTLYLSVAGMETDALPLAAAFADQLQRPPHTGLEVRFSVIEDLKHVSMKGSAVAQGLRHARFD